MLIVSDYKDYYDTVQSLGVDKTCVYNRKEKEIEIDYNFYQSLRAKKKIGALPFTMPNYEHVDNVYYYFFVIGFCGKLYFGYEWSDPKTYESRISYDLEALENLLNSKKKFWNRWGWNNLKVSDLRKQEQQRYDDFFISHNVPIFMIRSKKMTHRHSDLLTLNPQLKPFEFYKHRDVYSTYQDIYSYISGVLGTKEKEIVEVSEKDKLISKGFDTKWSFRNPEPPKRKQKNNGTH